MTQKNSSKIISLGFILNIPVGYILWSILWYGQLGALGFTIMIALILNGFLLAQYWSNLPVILLKKSLLGWLSMVLNHILFFGTEFFIFRQEAFSFEFVSYGLGVVVLYYPFCWLGFLIFKIQKKGS